MSENYLSEGQLVELIEWKSKYFQVAVDTTKRRRKPQFVQLLDNKKVDGKWTVTFPANNNREGKVKNLFAQPYDNNPSECLHINFRLGEKCN